MFRKNARIAARRISSPNVAKIATHPVVGGSHRPALEPNPCGCGLGLQFVGQPIKVATLPVVEKTPDGIEEVDRVHCVRPKRRRQQLFGTFPLAGMLHFRDLRQPARHLIVPQTAGTILDIRLEMKNGSAVFFVSQAG